MRTSLTSLYPFDVMKWVYDRLPERLRYRIRSGSLQQLSKCFHAEPGRPARLRDLAGEWVRLATSLLGLAASKSSSRAAAGGPIPAAALDGGPDDDLNYPSRLSQSERISMLEEKVTFLNYEVSNLRKLVRYLAADSMHILPLKEQTYGSFDYQWSHLPEGRWMLSNPGFREILPTQICEYTGLSPEWFAGKDVLDAGCGLGRYSYGLCKLGACVTAVDQAAGGIEATRNNCAEFGSQIEIIRANLVSPLPVRKVFDLVWSFGVLHHTGNTHRAFLNLVPLVKPGGFFFVMIYGEPRLHRAEDYRYFADLEFWRRRCRNRPYAERVEVLRQAKGEENLHGYFDAISPEINDLYSFDELEQWFLEAGFVDLKRTLDHRNHFLIARRPV